MVCTLTAGGGGMEAASGLSCSVKLPLSPHNLQVLPFLICQLLARSKSPQRIFCVKYTLKHVYSCSVTLALETDRSDGH